MRCAGATASSVEGYHCRYGINPELRDALTSGDLRISAEDDQKDARAIELTNHPFFVATLYQPERAALEQRVPPLVLALATAAVCATRAPGSCHPTTPE